MKNRYGKRVECTEAIDTLFRSSLSHMLFKIGVYKISQFSQENKRLCWSLFLIK